jgi:hypothetical protein
MGSLVVFLLVSLCGWTACYYAAKVRLFMTMPELSLVHNVGDRRAILVELLFNLPTSSWETRALMGCVVGYVIGVGSIGFKHGVPESVMYALWLWGFPGLLVLRLWVFRSRVIRHTRYMLQSLDIPVCLYCGYDMRGQVTRRCPECDMPYNLRLPENGRNSPSSEANRADEDLPPAKAKDVKNDRSRPESSDGEG